MALVTNERQISSQSFQKQLNMLHLCKNTSKINVLTHEYTS